MNRLRFSHDYVKIKNIRKDRPVTLIEVLEINTSDLSKPMKWYDTIYYELENNHEIEKHYDLRGNTESLFLLFIQGYNMFCTIRRKTPNILAYYKKNIGKNFLIDMREKLPDCPNVTKCNDCYDKRNCKEANIL